MPLTQQQLQTHLWKAADILRGRIDSGEYKHYIFGLLFFKRLSDVWHEEYEERLETYDGDEGLAADPDEHRFHIPRGHFWEDVRARTTDIGAALNQAFHAIEDQNLRIKGVFQDVEPDVLGAAYEYLIAQFADDSLAVEIGVDRVARAGRVRGMWWFGSGAPGLHVRIR